MHEGFFISFCDFATLIQGISVKKALNNCKKEDQTNTIINVVTFYKESKWGKAFKSGLSKFCGRQPLKNLKGYGLLKGLRKVCFLENIV